MLFCHTLVYYKLNDYILCTVTKRIIKMTELLLSRLRDKEKKRKKISYMMHANHFILNVAKGVCGVVILRQLLFIFDVVATDKW